MAARTADTFGNIPHGGVYGNLSAGVGSYADLSTNSAVALDTFDFVKIPGGAQVVEGFIYSTQMTGTSTWALGIKYADGTSTGGTTGTNVLFAGTSSVITGLGQTSCRFQPFTNDADTIAYVTHVSGPAHTALDNATLVVKYIANYTK
jgi:hypothetical protein